MNREEDLKESIEIRDKLKALMDEYSIGGAMVRTGWFRKPIMLSGIPPPQYMMDSYLEMEKHIQELQTQNK